MSEIGWAWHRHLACQSLGTLRLAVRSSGSTRRNQDREKFPTNGRPLLKSSCSVLYITKDCRCPAFHTMQLHYPSYSFRFVECPLPFFCCLSFFHTAIFIRYTLDLLVLLCPHYRVFAHHVPLSTFLRFYTCVCPRPFTNPQHLPLLTPFTSLVLEH